MTDLQRRIAALSAEKRRLLELMLSRQQGAARDVPILPVPRDTRAFPLSFAQQRLSTRSRS
jgi:hypothetical protein